MPEMSVLSLVGRRVRMNHALEHGTISILSGRVPDVILRGRSNRRGFYVLGDVSTEAVVEAANEALARFKSGESGLAIHPFCGTNLAVAGLLSGTASAIAVRASKRGERFPASILAALVALAVAQPLGFWVQRTMTTESRMGDLRIVSVVERGFLGRRLHFVSTSPWP